MFISKYRWYTNVYYYAEEEILGNSIDFPMLRMEEGLVINVFLKRLGCQIISRIMAVPNIQLQADENSCGTFII